VSAFALTTALLARLWRLPYFITSVMPQARFLQQRYPEPTKLMNFEVHVYNGVCLMIDKFGV
jgi:hypothetical protein